MATDYGTRTGPQQLWLAGAGVLLAVLVIGGGLLVWRGLGPSTPTLASEPTGAGEPSAHAAVAFGAPEVVDGVPWGYPLTPDGAAAAAVTTVAVTGQPQAVFDHDRFAQVADLVFTDEQATMQARQVEAARAEFAVSGWAAQPPSRRTYFFTPLAVRLADWDPDGSTATVEVWAMTIVGVGDAGGAVFTTSTVTLTGDAGTWIIEGLDSVEGPTPMVQAAATAPGRTRGFLRDAAATVPLPAPGGGVP